MVLPAFICINNYYNNYILTWAEVHVGNRILVGKCSLDSVASVTSWRLHSEKSMRIVLGNLYVLGILDGFETRDDTLADH